MIKLCHFPNAYNNITLTLVTKPITTKNLSEIHIFYAIMKKNSTCSVIQASEKRKDSNYARLYLENLFLLQGAPF